VRLLSLRLEKVFFLHGQYFPAPTESAGESFAALSRRASTAKEMRIGEVITAEVVSVDENFVVVNAGLKSESIIAVDEFRNDAGQVEVKPGDFVSVSIEALEDGYGAPRASRATRRSAWPPGSSWRKALETGEKVEGVITGKVKGGLTVMTKGIRAFLPGSLVDLRPVKDTTPTRASRWNQGHQARRSGEHPETGHGRKQERLEKCSALDS